MVGIRWTLAFVAVAGFSIAGCGGSGSNGARTEAGGGDGQAGHDHDHEGHDHADPKDLHEASEVLAEMRDELAEAYKAADVKAVDGVIHEMGPVLKKAKEMVTSSDLDRYAQKEVEAALQQITDVLTELHPSHGADAKVDPADFDAQKDSLNDAISNLHEASEKPEAAATN